MAKLAILGGKAVRAKFLAQSSLVRRHDLEQEYLLDAHNTGIWDDWPWQPSQASKFAREFARFQGSKYCVLATNGTHTLQLALEALDIGYGDEVIVPGLTWQATAATVVDVNAVPILVDVDARTLCIDVKKIEAAITRRTRAIVPVHLFNRMADMDAIMRIARKHKLHVVEDCAHTHGSKWRGKGAGTFGAFGSFSFQRGKLITGGEGGGLLTQDEDLRHKVDSMRMCGRLSGGIRIHNGNYRMTAFQGAILRGQLAALRKNAPVMDRRGKALDKAVDAAPGTESLRRDKRVTRQVGYGYTFFFEPKKWDGIHVTKFRAALSAELGIGIGRPYSPLSHSPFYSPQTKKRHRLSKEYLKAIDPARWDMPVADDAVENRCVSSNWRILGCTADAPGKLTDAIAKVYENREDLRAYELKDAD